MLYIQFHIIFFTFVVSVCILAQEQHGVSCVHQLGLCVCWLYSNEVLIGGDSDWVGF